MDNNKRANLNHWSPRIWGERGGETEKVFERIRTENFPKSIWGNINLQIHEAEKTPNRIKPNKFRASIS